MNRKEKTTAALVCRREAMAFGIRWRSRAMLLVMLVAAGVGVLVVQRYAYSLLTPHQTSVRRQVQRLRDEGALFHAQPSDPHSSGDPPDPTRDTGATTKVVLMHAFPYFYELRSGPQHFSSCNQSCTLTLDRELSSEVDCVILYSHHYESRALQVGRGSQMWVYFAVESPFNSFNRVFGKPEWHHLFNWTMTYRRDSDFYFGYGDIIRRSLATPARDFAPLVKNKTKLVAWFVSNCQTQSRREDFVSALKKFVKVDVYGACGPLKCGKEGNQTCIDMLSTDYYFYLSFENSMCKDYITEKLYRTMKRADVVPVVRGGANYSAVLPRDSFIDASQFSSVKALADHLTKVAGDPELYQRHLAWKNSLAVVEPMPFPFCDVCYKLHHADRRAHAYPNIDQWWHEDACHDPPAVVKS